MNINQNINKLLYSLKQKGQTYKINSFKFYSEKKDKYSTKYQILKKNKQKYITQKQMRQKYKKDTNKKKNAIAKQM